MKSGRLKIALIGYGYWGKIFLPYLDERFDVVKVFGRSLRREGRFTHNLYEVWRSDAVAVVVATPIDAHYQIVLDALHCGKHVLCEKPLTLTTQEAEHLRATALEKNLHLIIDFTYNFSRGLIKMAELASVGVVGKPRYIELSLMRQVTMNRRERFTLNQLYAAKLAHLLAILSTFTALEDLQFTSTLPAPPNLTTVEFEGPLSGSMRVSADYPAKEMRVVLTGTEGKMEYCMENKPSLCVLSYAKEIAQPPSLPARYLTVGSKMTYDYDEANNLVYTTEYLRRVLVNRGDLLLDNSALAVEVTRILVDICGLTKEETDK